MPDVSRTYTVSIDPVRHNRVGLYNRLRDAQRICDLCNDFSDAVHSVRPYHIWIVLHDGRFRRTGRRKPCALKVAA